MTAAPAPLVPTPCPIRRRKAETPDVFTMELEAPAGWPRFHPGQFHMLYVFGIGESAISISGDATRSGTLVHTVRSVGAVTRAMARLRRGDAVGVRGPYGRGWPVDEAIGRDVVLVAGGIGLAPLRPVVYELVRRRGEFGRIALLVGARSPADVLYPDELARWRAAHGIDVHVTVDHATRDWSGDVGIVTTQLPGAAFDGATAVAFLCGPEVMMRFAATALARRGLSADRIHVSLERNMKCAVALCGRCQLGPTFVCKDGPVMPYARVDRLLGIREI